MTSFNQEQILGIRAKNPNRPLASFRENPLIASEYVPGLDIFTGNTLDTFSSALVLAAGQLQVSPVYFGKVLEVVSETSYNHRTIDLALNRKGLFESQQNMLQLRGDGQTNYTTFYEVNPNHNKSILAAAASFSDTLAGLTDDEIDAWTALTGSKVKNQANSAYALEVIKTLATSPDNNMLLSTELGATNETNPAYAACRRMAELGAIELARIDRHTVNAKDGRVIPAYYASITAGYEDIFARFSDLQDEYADRLYGYLDHGLAGLFDTEINDKNHFGIKPQRMRVIANALSVYNLQSFSSRS